MGKSVITLKLFLILALIFLSQSIKTNAQQNIPQNSYSYLGLKNSLKSTSSDKKFTGVLNSNIEKYVPPINNYRDWELGKHFAVSAGELAVVEFIPWAMAKWIRKWNDPSKNWANVGLKSWRNNLSSGWEYDGDAFLTNYFAHPYHGNLYFNIGRANGYDFWESIAWSFAGSAIWEEFGETYRPAFNDWINTSVNGVTLGEITYRLSTYVTDNTATGSKRVLTEIAGALINPVRGVSRLLSGEVTRVFPNPEWRIPENFYLLFDAGFRQLDRSGDAIIKEGIQEGLFDFEVYYNHGFAKDLQVPFSSFYFSVSLSSGSPNLTELTAVGNLYGWPLKLKSNVSHILNISLEYDYQHNPGFVYGGTTVTPQLFSVFKLNEKLDINTILGLSLVMMGATPNDFYIDVEGRNYDFGPGIGNYFAAALKKGIWDLVRIYYQGQWIWTQSEPSDSKHHLHVLWIDTQYPLTSYFAVGIGGGVFWRESYYKYYENVISKMPIAKVFFKTAIF